jgi:hypothetical protein
MTMMKELHEDWSQTKAALLEGLDARRAKIVEPVLENQRKALLETAASDMTSAGAIGNFQKIVIPMIRRIIPGTIASEIVGVQPLSGPVGLVYSLRFIFAHNMVPATADAGLGTITGGTDEVFGNTSATAPFAGKMMKYYSGGTVIPASDYYPGSTAAGATNGADTTFHTADTQQSGTADNVYGGYAGLTAAMESYLGKGMQLTVLKQTVTAGTRKLSAKWSVEAMQDISAQHGLDLESEITQALSAEIVHEMDNEIVSDLLTLAGSAATFDMSGAFTGTPNYVGDRHAVLGILINKVANDIAAKTRRGAGNFLVVSPQVVSVLQSGSKSVFAPSLQGSFEGPNNTKMVGTLNGQLKVYSFLFNATSGIQDNILVGYKGGNGETDTGYFYCPYVPLTASSVVTDPVTFNQHVQLMTRYGKATFTSSATSLANSADYYGKITVSNLTFV